MSCRSLGGINQVRQSPDELRDKFIRHTVATIEDVMREQADILGTTNQGLSFDFEEELAEVMEALQDEIARQLHLALNQTTLDLE